MSEKVEYIISLKDLFLKQIKEDSKAVDEFENKIKSSESTLERFGKIAAGAFVISGLTSFAKEVTNIGAKFESYEAGLATLLKSESEAHTVFEQIKEDAKNTKFDTESILIGEKALISAGSSAKEARDDIMNLSNAIAATGGGSDELSRMAVNMQQIKNLGKASALDIKQFAFAGINIYQLLADATGKSKEEVKGMEVSYDLLSMALAKAAKEGGAYAGANERLAKGMEGQLSNLEESITFLKVELYEALRPAIASVVSGLASFVNIMQSAIKWGREHATLVKSIAAAVGTIVVGILAYNAAVGVARLATEAWTVAQMVLNGAMTANPIGLIIVGIGLLVGAIVYAWNKFEGFRGAIVGTWEMLKELTVIIKDGLVNVLTGLGDIIGGIFTFDQDKISGGIKKAMSGLSDVAITTFYKNKDRLAGAFNKGYEDAKDMTWENPLANMGSQAGSLMGSGGGPEVSPSGAGATLAPSASKVSSVKPTQINITIDGLVKGGVTIMSNTVTEGASKIRQIIAEELMKAVNDSQRVAGI